MKAIKWAVTLIVIAVAIVIGWLMFSSDSEDIDVDDESLVPIGDISSPLPLADPVASKAPAVVQEEATLAAVSPYTGAGSATRSFDGSTFTHAVTADISHPAAGKFYEGWLVMPTASGPQFFSTGKMAKSGNNYTLNYTANQNFPRHTNVVITEETEADGLDNKPEAHVLEGSF